MSVCIAGGSSKTTKHWVRPPWTTLVGEHLLSYYWAENRYTYIEWQGKERKQAEPAVAGVYHPVGLTQMVTIAES
jgi:hypothetical protein